MYSEDLSGQGRAQTDAQLARGHVRWAQGQSVGFLMQHALVALADGAWVICEYRQLKWDANEEV
jgi:hypothetical protein